jgi:hypothetical protein
VHHSAFGLTTVPVCSDWSAFAKLLLSLTKHHVDEQHPGIEGGF